MKGIRTIQSRSERAQTTAEFALILPALMMILLGILQFGVLFRDYLTLTDAVREGARKAAVARIRSGDRDAYVRQEVVDSASDLNGFTTANVEVDTSWRAGEDVEVTAHYPFSINVLGWVVRSGDMTSTATERVE